jgi:hypothetical protein
MEPEEIEITIDKEGRITVKVHGAPGTSCLALTRDLENAAGFVEQREYTAEFYEQAEESREFQRLGSR